MRCQFKQRSLRRSSCLGLSPSPTPPSLTNQSEGGAFRNLFLLTNQTERRAFRNLFPLANQSEREVRSESCRLRPMQATLKWAGGLRFDASPPTGFAFSFDSPEDGTPAAGPQPMETLLCALAACTAMDVISILLKKRQRVTGYRVEIE